MVTYSDTTLADTFTPSASAVNSGSAVYLNCTGVDMNTQVFTQIPQLPGKSVTATGHNELLAQGDYIGVDNPTIQITGVIDLKKYDTTTGAAPSNIISLALIMQFAKCGHVLELTDHYDSSTTTPVYRLCTLSGDFLSETVTTVKCMVTGWSVNTDSSGQVEGHVLTYTLNLREVQG